ncbi:Essential MCU regulator [Mactra antiquata]
MATRLASFANLCKNPKASGLLRTNAAPVTNIVRCLSERGTSIQGAIPSEPLRTRFSFPQVMAFICLGTFVGQYLAKSFAAFLEETEMFVPDDDDD